VAWERENIGARDCEAGGLMDAEEGAVYDGSLRISATPGFGASAGGA
jgi:hypothetical protein